MNPVLEEKLRELIEESNRQIAPAVSTVLNLLLGACLEGRQNEFAKHCCRVSPIFITGMTINDDDDGESGWSDIESQTYIN
jgi:hypothetical protein